MYHIEDDTAYFKVSSMDEIFDPVRHPRRMEVSLQPQTRTRVSMRFQLNLYDMQIKHRSLCVLPAKSIECRLFPREAHRREMKASWQTEGSNSVAADQPLDLFNETIRDNPEQLQVKLIF